MTKIDEYGFVTVSFELPYDRQEQIRELGAKAMTMIPQCELSSFRNIDDYELGVRELVSMGLLFLDNA